jgi:hypothetical protein
MPIAGEESLQHATDGELDHGQRTIACEITREIENIAESVRRHPALHHDCADRLLVLARELRDAAARAKTQPKAKRAKRSARRATGKRR